MPHQSQSDAVTLHVFPLWSSQFLRYIPLMGPNPSLLASLDARDNVFEMHCSPCTRHCNSGRVKGRSFHHLSGAPFPDRKIASILWGCTNSQMSSLSLKYPSSSSLKTLKWLSSILQIALNYFFEQLSTSSQVSFK